jgi:4-carboxymuconolactone decarboxylase
MQMTSRSGRRQLMAQGGAVALGAIVLSGALTHTAAQDATPITDQDTGMMTDDALQAVSPALARYQQETLFGDLWNRPGLSYRDRSIVTLSALIARNQTANLPAYLTLALDNGVTAGEISEIITHLAFYTGWESAMAAIPATQEVFAQRGIGADQLPVASPELLPQDAAAEEQRETMVQQSMGPVSPGMVDYTRDPLFAEVWLRPDLAPRDRSLVTVSALIAVGQLEQLPSHLNRAMNNGLTQEEVGEMLAHLAFYAGWPRIFSAAPVVGGVLDERAS